MLMKMRYGSPKALKFTEKLMRFITNESYRASALLGAEKGSCPLLDKEKYLQSEYIKKLDSDVIDMIRRRRQTDDRVDTLVDPTSGPEQSALEEDRDRVLKLALASLSPEQRQIIVLRDYMDLPYAEIAAVLDIAAGTVMSRLHRARTALGKAYREYDD